MSALRQWWTREPILGFSFVAGTLALGFYLMSPPRELEDMDINMRTRSVNRYYDLPLPRYVEYGHPRAVPKPKADE